MKSFVSRLVSFVVAGVLCMGAPMAEARGKARTPKRSEASRSLFSGGGGENGGVVTGEAKPKVNKPRKLKKNRLSRKARHSHKRKSTAGRSHNQFKREKGFPKRQYDKQGTPVNR